MLSSTVRTFFGTALLFLGTLASPLATSSDLSARQGPDDAPRVYVRFFMDDICSTEWAEDTVFLETGTHGLAGCQDLSIGPYPSIYFYENNFNATVRFYTLPCSQLSSVDSWHHVDIAPGQDPGCQVRLPVRSWITL
ncbi:hypothetical protein GMOD_00004340 [Pyrenophora seminiperda CCB06]|uniref:Uncharacterized protein n=1 Tax=Pyrenophora seminiperda CCB06 TaxID=1302712 RepID=A0A3M7M167_9PLEO|nr:hypothetical protein GMOD_00004340 [Pyrenophora seminiperda CCB06]